MWPRGSVERTLSATSTVTTITQGCSSSASENYSNCRRIAGCDLCIQNHLVIVMRKHVGRPGTEFRPVPGAPFKPSVGLSGMERLILLPPRAFLFFFGQDGFIVLTAIENPDYTDPIFVLMEGDGDALSIAGNA